MATACTASARVGHRDRVVRVGGVDVLIVENSGDDEEVGAAADTVSAGEAL